MRIFIVALFTMQTCFAQAQTPTEQTTTETPATESQPSETYQLQQVQILGNKEEKSYLESTESISVLKADEYDKGVKTDSIKALNALPNVQVNKNDNTFSLRGINNIGVTGYQKDNLASIIVDDVFQTDLAISAGAFDFWDLDHVEIYRGAQSTTQGINSLAGNILLFHRKAGEQTEGAAKAGLGTYGSKEVGAVTNNTFLDKKLLTRFAVNVERYDGFITNVTTGNDRWGRQDKNYLTGDMIYKINAHDELRWNVKIMQTENGGTYSQSADPFKYEVIENVDSRALTNNQQSSLRYSTRINENSSNETILAYSQADQDSTADSDGTSNPASGIRYENHTDSYLSVENLWKYQSDKVKNVLGVHYHDYTINNDYDFTLLPAPGYVRQKTEKYQKSYAVFNSLLFKLNESHAMNLGLRYEYMVNKFDSYVFAFGTPRVANGNEEGGILLPKIAYTITEGLHSYGASYTQGYRTGGVSVNRWTSAVSQYDPETTDNFELSYKFVQEKSRVAANVFYTHWKDQQVLVQYSPGNPYDSATLNAASSEIYGAELEGQYSINSRNVVSAGVGYNHTRFIDFKSPTGVVYDGNQFPFASPWTGNVNYTFKPNDKWNWDNTLRYLAAGYGDAANTNAKKTPEQWYLDTSLSYLLAQWNLNTEFFIRNVLDQKYVIFDASGSSFKAYQVNAPREFGARVTYFW
ncbi:TonB-dependent receptor [Bdellovibrio sp. HCB288]|uniref:TonB-dependent receptor n=1 Tax=Bdellovibrio sp. HCB288 TaxID=3394355 RepID=UPI0039B5BDCA